MKKIVSAVSLLAALAVSGIAHAASKPPCTFYSNDGTGTLAKGGGGSWSYKPRNMQSTLTWRANGDDSYTINWRLIKSDHPRFPAGSTGTETVRCSG